MIAENLLHFSRILRKAGILVSPEQVLLSLQTFKIIGFNSREDIRCALASVMLNQREQKVLFDIAFDSFWSDIKLAELLMNSTLSSIKPTHTKTKQTNHRRLLEDFSDKPKTSTLRESIESFDYSNSFSEKEILRAADFETMSSAEFILAKKIAESLPIPIPKLRTYRVKKNQEGLINLRLTLKNMSRQPFLISPIHTNLKDKIPSIVVLLDISGSMDRYARLMLHYLHGLTRHHVKVSTFTFGTKLTSITRCLKNNDPDIALKLVEELVVDWGGGTRLASCLDEFNRNWAKQLLSSRSSLWLITDGLDGEITSSLEPAIKKLSLSAHHIVWLNPLLRYSKFEPEAPGIKLLLQYVNYFLPMHNLNHLANLEQELRKTPKSIQRQKLSLSYKTISSINLNY